MDEIAENKNGLRIAAATESPGGSEKAKAPKKNIVAVRTGFVRRDDRSGRTVEAFLCSEMRKTSFGFLNPEQLSVFFVNAEEDTGHRVFCSGCQEKHRTVDIFDAIIEGRVTTGPGDDGSCINLAGWTLVTAIIETARPRPGTR